MPRPPFLILTSMYLSISAPALFQAVDAQNEPGLREKSVSSSSNKRRLAVGANALYIPAPHSVSASPKTIGAVRALSNLKSTGSSYPSTPLQRGLYLKQQGKLKEALLEFIRSAQENPRLVRAFYEQAQIFKQTGRPKLAKSALEQALAISPDYVDARTMLVQTQFETGNLIGAASEVGKLFNLNKKESGTKKESANFLAYQGAPSAVVEIAKGKLPGAGSDFNLTSKSQSANALAPSTSGASVKKNSLVFSASADPSKSPKDETSAWLQAAGGDSEPSKAASTETAEQSADASAYNDLASRLGLPKTESGEKALLRAPQENLEIASKPSPSTAEILASLGVKQSIESTPATTGVSSTKNVSTKNSDKSDKSLLTPGANATQSSSLLSKMKARTSKVVNVSSISLPDWMKGQRDALKDCTSSVMTWMKDRLPQDKAPEPQAAMKEEKSSKLTALTENLRKRIPFSNKDKHNELLSKKIDSAIESSAKKQSELPPEVAKAIESKLGIKKEGKNAELKPGELKGSDAKLADGKTATQKAIEEKLAEARLALANASKNKGDSKEIRPGEVVVVQYAANDPKLAAAKTLENKIAESNGSDGRAVEPKGNELNSEVDQQQRAALEAAALAAQQGKRIEGGGSKDLSVANDSESNKNEASSSSSAPPAILAMQAGATAVGEVKATELDGVQKVLAALNLPTNSEAGDNQNAKADSESSGSKAQEKPAYGLLSNTTIKHLSAMRPPEVREKPSFIDGLWKQAGSTFLHLMPKIDWKLPSLPTPNLFPAPEQSPQAIIATADISGAPQSSEAIMAPQKHAPIAAPAPVPLDVTRILNKLSPAAPPAPIAGAAPALSSIIPMAGTTNIDRYIPVPQDAPQIAKGLPQMTPQGLQRNGRTTTGPLTSPQEQTTQSMLPAVVQDVINQAQPLLKPAVNAATAIAQTFVPPPLVIPKEGGASPDPVAMSKRSVADTQAPAPIGADMQKYLNNDLVPTQVQQAEQAADETPLSAAAASAVSAAAHSTGGRKLVSISKEKTGAFTFMKPVMDTDRNYILGAKQVRTIQPLPGKPQEAKPAPPEDPITKRMRYYVEHGTSNMPPGEAFMYSEQTGEGVLFMRGGRTERRKLADPQEAEKLLRERRPDIVKPRDLQYSLSLLGKLMPTEKGASNDAQPVTGPTLDQLMNQVNQGQKSVWGWMKDTFKF